MDLQWEIDAKEMQKSLRYLRGPGILFFIVFAAKAYNDNSLLLFLSGSLFATIFFFASNLYHEKGNSFVLHEDSLIIHQVRTGKNENYQWSDFDFYIYGSDNFRFQLLLPFFLRLKIFNFFIPPNTRFLLRPKSPSISNPYVEVMATENNRASVEEFIRKHLSFRGKGLLNIPQVVTANAPWRLRWIFILFGVVVLLGLFTGILFYYFKI